jgi:hypothetical protein
VLLQSRLHFVIYVEFAGRDNGKLLPMLYKYQNPTLGDFRLNNTTTEKRELEHKKATEL